MRKIFIFPLIVIIVTTLCSCSKTNSSNITVKGQCDEIIRCFNEKDSDGLKSMFCETVKKTENLDEQIENAFDFIDGEITSYDYLIGSESKSVDEGKVTKKRVYPWITEILTDKNRKYEMQFDSYIIYENKDEAIGIICIEIFDREADTSCKIGEYVY